MILLDDLMDLLQVTHSPEGMETLRYFLFDICGVTAGWKMEDVLEEELKIIKETVGPDDHVICGLSGGVDSTVAATLVHKAIGDRLHCAFVDNGLLRLENIHFYEIEKNLHKLLFQKIYEGACSKFTQMFDASNFEF